MWARATKQELQAIAVLALWGLVTAPLLVWAVSNGSIVLRRIVVAVMVAGGVMILIVLMVYRKRAKVFD
jgi:hypothetical protein